MEALTKHFVPKLNVVACRHKFRQRSQRNDETVPQYISALRELAVQCQYGAMEQEMLPDQLVEQAWLPAVRDRLLLEDELTLQKAVNLACQVESAVRNASLLSGTDASGN